MASTDSNPRDGTARPVLERFLSIAEVSRVTGIPKRTIYDAIDRGEITCFVPNGCKRGFRVAESEVARWISSCTRATA